MKKFLRTREAAATVPRNPILAEYAKAMEPAQKTLQRSVGSLSMEQYLLDQRHAERVNANANMAVVKVLGSLLPKARESAAGENSFIVQGVDRAKAVQANVVWWRGSFPGYLVGERPTDSPKWREIMLLGAGSAQTVRTALVHAQDFQESRDRALTVLTTPYSEQELNTLYDAASDQFIIDRKAVGNMPKPHVPRTFGATMNGAPESVTLESGLSPDMMELFDVESHLNDLATVFGCVDELHSLYAGRDEAIASHAR